MGPQGDIWSTRPWAERMGTGRLEKALQKGTALSFLHLTPWKCVLCNLAKLKSPVACRASLPVWFMLSNAAGSLAFSATSPSDKI